MNTCFGKRISTNFLDGFSVLKNFLNWFSFIISSAFIWVINLFYREKKKNKKLCEKKKFIVISTLKFISCDTCAQFMNVCVMVYAIFYVILKWCYSCIARQICQSTKHVRCLLHLTIWREVYAHSYIQNVRAKKSNEKKMLIRIVWPIVKW